MIVTPERKRAFGGPWFDDFPLPASRPNAESSASTPSELKSMTSNKLNALLLTAALTGLIGGTSVAAQAATNGSNGASVKAAKAGLRLTSADKPPKHSCKGKNDCKGQGGCKSSDNGCKAKNSCKGKGGCATDGSKMPDAV